MCGSTAIDGYAFCLGLKSLNLSYEAYPDLQSLIRSITYLIRGAIFRPRYATSQSDVISLSVCPLGELIDMYHTREASERHDKVYALLGMSSDDLSTVGLRPDYEIPWEKLFRQLIGFLLCHETSVATWCDKEIAVIKSKGCILGRVSSVSNCSWGEMQNVSITSESSEGGREWIARWALPVSAERIMGGDLVCLLQGALKPTVIRPYKDYFAIIMIAATPPESIQTGKTDIKWLELLQTIITLPLSLLLVWNWERSSGGLQGQERSETLRDLNSLKLGHLKTDLDKATRLFDMALILRDLGEYEEAGRKLREVVEDYERLFGNEHLHTLTAVDALALIYKNQKKWKEVAELFLQVIQARKRVQGVGHQDMLSRIADVASIYVNQAHLEEWELLRMTALVNQIRGNVRIREGEVIRAINLFGQKMTTLLLYLRRDKVPITENVVKAATKSWDGKEVMALLLDQRGSEVKITEEVVKAAAGNWSIGKEVIALLLNRRGSEVKITEEVVKAAAGNWSNGKEVIALLLNQRGSEVKITEEVVKAAAGNRGNGKEVMALLLNQRGSEFKITEEVVKAVARNWRNGKEVMALLLNQRGSEFKITEEVVKAAARSRNGKEVVALLLDQRGSEIKITEEVFKEAVSNEYASNELIQLLHQAVGIKVTIAIIEAAATSGQERLLDYLDRWGSIGNSKDRWLGISRLYNAAKSGDATTVRQLVYDGIPPDKPNIHGATPLWRASQSGHKEAVQVLLTTNAVDVNAWSRTRRTPLFWAAANGHSEVVQLLLDYGAEQNYTDEDGRSPLSIAQFYCQAEVINILTRHNVQERVCRC